MIGHTIHDAECADCQANWITKRWGCMSAIARVFFGDPVPRCPECGAADAVSHPYDCEFWYGAPSEAASVGQQVVRFNDTEPYSPDYERLEPDGWNFSRHDLFLLFVFVGALIVMPTLPHGSATLAVVGALLSSVVAGEIRRRRRRP